MRRTSLAETLRILSADVQASLDVDEDTRGASPLLRAAKLLFTVRLQAVVMFRLSQWLRGFLPPAGAIVKYFNCVITGCDIASEAVIGPGLCLFHPIGVVVGPDCQLGAGCVLMQGVTVGIGRGGAPRLGDRVFVGPGAKVVGSVTLGDGCQIAANAVVVDSVPAGCLAGGIPARVIGSAEEGSET